MKLWLERFFDETRITCDVMCVLYAYDSLILLDYNFELNLRYRRFIVIQLNSMVDVVMYIEVSDFL